MDSHQDLLQKELLVLKTKVAENEELSQYEDILDDDFLLGFIRGKKCDNKKAFDCLLLFMHIRTKKYKEFTRLHLPSSLTTVWSLNKVRLLKNKDPNGYFVAFDQIKLWDPSIHTVYEMIAQIMFLVDEALRSYSSQSADNKGIVIFNFEGASLQQIRHLSPRLIIQLIDMFQTSLPGRPAAIHVLNEGRIVRGGYNLVKGLINPKVRNRIYFHSSDLTSLHEHVPASILPKSLGGQLTDEEAFDYSIVDKIRSRDEFYKRLGK